MVKRNEDLVEHDPLEGNEEYRCFIDKLAESNVDRYIDLPMIAVMGDTSSGKSSLLSMLSMIELPSSDELTTRCPIMLTMKRSTVKSAQVQVIWKDKPSGKTEKDVDFPAETVCEENWTDLTRSIARAQKHIVDVSGKEVARDVVSVKISSPHCENLTLIDLPGIVRATGKGESESLAKDIQSLIEDYLQNPRCVILAVHPSNVDFHNSQIMAEARKVDPETKRTLPVLTKPDLIDQGAEASVRDLLLGLKTDSFERGFHMVKGRSQASLSARDSIDVGLDHEDAFFRNMQPWRDTEDKNLFGTKNLRIKLSFILMQLIRDTFPSIISEMKDEKNRAFADFIVLGEAPQVTAEKRIKFMEVKDKFIKMLRPTLLGGNLKEISGEKCSAQFHLRCKDFKDTLHSSQFSNISDINVSVDAIAIDVDGTVVKDKVAFLDGGKVYLSNWFVEAKMSQSDDHGKPEGTVWKADDSNIYVAESKNTSSQLHAFEASNVRRDPAWILKLIKEHRPYTLPLFVNEELFEMIVSQSIEGQWAQPSFKLLEDLSVIMLKAISDALDKDKVIQRFPKLLFYMKRKVDGVIEELTTSTRKKVHDFIESEKIPYSQDHYLFENVSRMRSKYLKDDLIRSIDVDSTNYTGKQFLQKIESAFERNQKKSVDDHMAEEMMHVLDAYGKVAFKRFCDTVPMICSKGLLHSFADKINEALSSMADDEIDRLLMPPPNEQARRENLKRKLDTLECALSAFDHLY